jgi:integrase
LRRGELLGLKWGDIDLDRGVLCVRHALASDKTLTQTKSSKGRSVRLTPIAVKALERHRERQAGKRAKLDGLWRESGLVFTSRVGTPLDPDNFIHRSFKPMLRRAGLPEVRFHDLRHTFATLMLSNGEHPKIVQEMLGHARISLTLDTYSLVLPSMQDGEVDRFEELLS